MTDRKTLPQVADLRALVKALHAYMETQPASSAIKSTALAVLASQYIGQDLRRQGRTYDGDLTVGMTLITSMMLKRALAARSGGQLEDM